MSVVKWSAVGLVSLLLPAWAATAQTPGAPDGPGATVASATTLGSVTPFQRALGDAIASRKVAGLPVPEAEYTFEVVDSAAPAGQGATPMLAPLAEVRPGRSVTIVGRTRVRFDGPAQAGYERWPRLIVRNESPDGALQLLEGDYTEAYREAVAQFAPGVWDQYEFGLEPRERAIEETITLTWPDGSPEPRALTEALGTGAPAGVPSLERILMGFTYAGPHINYTIAAKWEWCFFFGCLEIFEFKAGFELDWGLGVRLPALAELVGPEEMPSGSSASLSSALSPQDWIDSDYSAVGVAPENGNEFVLRFSFFVGVKAEIVGVDLCPQCYLAVDIDRSASFATPFGPGSSFPIPPALVPVRSFGVGDVINFELGLQIQPQLGSSRITADWQASGAASGGGEITYAAPGTPVHFAANACLAGPSRQAQITLQNFRYWFNEFLVELSAYLTFHLDDIGTWTPTIPIATFDLSPLTGGLWLGGHVQCDALFNCGPAGPSNTLQLSAPVADKTPPDITIVSPPGTVYANTDGIDIVWTASEDPLCGSGIASEVGVVDGKSVNNGESVSLLLFRAGPGHSVKVTATDGAANESTAVHSFEVSVDVDGLIAATRATCQLPWIVKPGICHSLEVKLLAAKASIGRGDLVPARNQLESFLHELDAQLDKAIEGRADDLLTVDARYVIEHLP